MHERFRHHFICPACVSELRLETFESNGSWVSAGCLACPSCGAAYPVIDGLPRIVVPERLGEIVGHDALAGFMTKFASALPPSLVAASTDRPADDSARTARFYAFMWRKYDTRYDSFDAREFDRLTGGSFDFSECRDMSVIDVGAGQGRFAYPLLAAGAKEVVCADLGQAITLANAKFRDEERVLCVQADIFALPFAPRFDISFCIGVLQHLVDPAKGLRAVRNLARPGGRTFLWCYGDSSVKGTLNTLRAIAKPLPIELQWLTAGLLAVARLTSARLRSLRGGEDPYAGYGLRYLQANTFDHLSTPIINFFTRKELEAMLAGTETQGSKLIERFPGQPNASWVIDIAT